MRARRVAEAVPIRSKRVLAATDLHKRYTDVVALDGCNLSVTRGRMLGLLGPNGSGKTTTMRAIFGLVRLDAGDVTWDGSPIGRAQRVRFGYMPEHRGLYPKMRIADQLVHLARLHGIAANDARTAADRWLDEFGLSDRADHALETLSHGNQQRVQLAAALVHGPELLVLDEPFSGLDPLGVDSMERVLRDLAANGVAIVFSSHQLDLVQSICDDVVVINQGRDILAGTLAELRSSSGHRHIEVEFDERAADLTNGWNLERDIPGATAVQSGPGTVRALVPSTTDPADVLAAARAIGSVSQFTFEPPSLSELFLEAVRS